MAIGKRYRKTRKSSDLLGISIEDALKYISDKWQPGMSWENKGANGWDVDHICPCFQAKTEEELIKLQHYTNLAPMWSMDNRIKCGSKTKEGEELCKILLGRDWID